MNEEQYFADQVVKELRCMPKERTCLLPIGHNVVNRDEEMVEGFLGTILRLIESACEKNLEPLLATIAFHDIRTHILSYPDVFADSLCSQSTMCIYEDIRTWIRQALNSNFVIDLKIEIEIRSVELVEQ